MLFAVVSTGCFSEPPTGDGDASEDGGTAMPTSGSASGPSDSSESAPATADATSSSEASSSDVSATGASTPYTQSNGAGDDGVSPCAEGDIAVGFQGHVDAALPAVLDLGPVCGRIELVMPG